jgi:hypothetical protein
MWRSVNNIEMWVWRQDECPPHVTAVCRPDHWTARFQFSMIDDYVELLDMRWLNNPPPRPLIQALAIDVQNNRHICRADWLNFHGDPCLDDHPVQGSPGSVSLFFPNATHLPGSVQSGTVVAGSAVYQFGIGADIEVAWNGNGTTNAEFVKEV